jgi:hypothetical protein
MPDRDDRSCRTASRHPSADAWARPFSIQDGAALASASCRFPYTDSSRPATEAAYFSPASTLAMRASKRAISSAFSFAV